MKKTNRNNLPKYITCVIDEYTSHDSEVPVEHRYSITELLNPVKETLLKRKYFDVIERDYSDFIEVMFGSAFHAMFENSKDDYVHELKMEYVHDGITIVGKIDLLDEENEEIIDFKTSSVNKVITKNFDENIKQCIAYAWLRKKTSFKYTNKIKLVYFMKDWKKMLVDVKSDYPKSPIYIYEKTLTTEDYEEIERYLLNKVKMLENNEIPDCTDEEMWKTPTKYALYKKQDSKKAFKIVESLSDVDVPHEKVEIRPGEKIKCNSYCVVRRFCEQSK